ncbi:MAG: TolC family protein [Oligoflexia bacterium]|nr:TolC family protein [Oligoflexia bacterium]
MKAFKWKTLVTVLSLVTPPSGLAIVKEEARELGFQEIWSAIRQQSPSLGSARATTEAADTARARAARHWFPRVYASGRSFVTDDPGTALFAKLGERNVTGFDFAPLALNDPGTQTHSRLTLGAELVLFEGGARVALPRAREAGAEATALEGKGAVQEEYRRSAEAYGLLLLLGTQRESLLRLQRLADATLSRYELAGRANPLGHSGYLGLQSLRHRINGELLQNEARRRGALEALQALLPEPAFWPEAWRPKKITLARHLGDTIESRLPTEPGTSFQLRARELTADAARSTASAQWSLFLPRVALFGEGSLSAGPGASATAYTAGLQLQWNLFHAPDYGAVGEARAHSRALELGARAQQAGEAAERLSLQAAARALSGQLELATQSLELLEEQSEIARKLFQNGLINALQLTEVYARRVDLIVAKTQMEEGLLKAQARLLTLSSVEISQ